VPPTEELCCEFEFVLDAYVINDFRDILPVLEREIPPEHAIDESSVVLPLLRRIPPGRFA